MKRITITAVTLGACLVSAAIALASQVALPTVDMGSGRISGPDGGAKVSVGQAFAGRADHVAGNYMGRLGIWPSLLDTYVASPVEDGLPSVVNRLYANYPNPFNPSTRIQFSLAKAADVHIDVYDLKGRRVDSIAEGPRAAGLHTITYEPKQLASGVYLVLMRADSFRAVQRIMLVK